MRNRMAVLLIGASLAGCQTDGNDEMARYLQRKDTVTLSAGDAKEVNRDTQMEAAWPRGVDDRKIPGSGTRAVRSIESVECRGPAATSTNSQTQVQSAPGAGTQVNRTSQTSTGSPC